jgi:adenylylsulfate kinase-like enzyme
VTSNAYVFWLTGLSGVGKSTIGRLLTQRLRQECKPVVYLDGDLVRAIYGNVLGHTASQRKAASMSYGRLCQTLCEQNVNVVFATISLFHEIQQWNRNNIPRYIEILIESPMNDIKQRDHRGIYSAHTKNLVGLDIPAEYPKSPDVTIQNGHYYSVERAVDKIMEYYNADNNHAA